MCSSDLVYVAIDNPKGVVQYGGTVAAPIAKTILNDAISALNIEKRDIDIDYEYKWNDKKYYEIPNVIGMERSDAIKELKHFTIEYTGSGKTVIEQSPKGGTNMQEGDSVRILLGN